MGPFFFHQWCERVNLRLKISSGHNVILWNLVVSDLLSYDIINLQDFPPPSQVVVALAEMAFSEAKKKYYFPSECTEDSCTLRSRTFISLSLRTMHHFSRTCFVHGTKRKALKDGYA